MFLSTVPMQGSIGFIHSGSKGEIFNVIFQNMKKALYIPAVDFFKAQNYITHVLVTQWSL